MARPKLWRSRWRRWQGNLGISRRWWRRRAANCRSWVGEWRDWRTSPGSGPQGTHTEQLRGPEREDFLRRRRGQLAQARKRRIRANRWEKFRRVLTLGGTLPERPAGGGALTFACYLSRPSRGCAGWFGQWHKRVLNAQCDDACPMC